MNAITKLLDNGSQLSFDGLEKYAAMIGESPSKGAKSPVLWNAVFAAKNIPAKMLPMDVPAENLASFVAAIRSDARCMGGAVTMPYKIDIIPFLDDIEPEAKIIGAVNCVYRKDGKLVGTNTDGAGAVASLKTKVPQLNGKKIALLGLGGAGLAVATYLAKEVGAEGTLFLVSRDPQKCEDVSQKLSRYCKVECELAPVSATTLEQASVLVNCTSVGFENVRTDAQGAFVYTGYTPLASFTDSVRVPSDTHAKQNYARAAHKEIAQNFSASLQKITNAPLELVFDAVYQPLQTTLLQVATIAGIPCLNGAGMNLEQAVIGCQTAACAANIPLENTDEIRAIMGSKW